MGLEVGGWRLARFSAAALISWAAAAISASTSASRIANAANLEAAARTAEEAAEEAAASNLGCRFSAAAWAAAAWDADFSSESRRAAAAVSLMRSASSAFNLALSTCRLWTQYSTSTNRNKHTHPQAIKMPERLSVVSAPPLGAGIDGDGSDGGDRLGGRLGEGGGGDGGAGGGIDGGTGSDGPVAIATVGVVSTVMPS